MPPLQWPTFTPPFTLLNFTFFIVGLFQKEKGAWSNAHYTEQELDRFVRRCEGYNYYPIETQKWVKSLNQN